MAKEKTPQCNKGCGQRVWFDWSAKAGEPGRSDFGKMRALQVSEAGEMLNQIHECPNSTYGKRGGGNGQQTKAPTLDTTTIETLLGNSYDHSARLEKMETTVNMIGTLDQQLSGKIDKLQHDFDQLSKYLVRNPLDDDGDSNRENPEPEP